MRLLRQALFLGCLFLLTSPAQAVDSWPRAPQIDGLFPEWSREFEARADGEFIYVRFALPTSFTLQGAPRPIRLVLDLDDDPQTRASALAEMSGLGPDLVVTFSPRRPSGARGSGVHVAGEGVTVGGQPVSAGRLGLIFSPITEARSFELRLARPKMLSGPDSKSFSLALEVEAGKEAPAWRSEVLQVGLPPRKKAERQWSAIPARGDGRLRLVSWNVLFARPLANPDPFARILRALDPDIVMLQEWEKVDDRSLAAWFNTHVPRKTTWHALTSTGWGVALVSRTPLTRLGLAKVARPDGAPADDFRPDGSLRVVAARTDTVLGPVEIASIHLRCCGYAGSWQDRARVAEVRTIHRMLSSAFDAQESIRVVGGDFNLVGSREPLEVLSAGLGRGGGDLQPAQAPLVGDQAHHTWRDPRSRFTPGRLDWILYDDAAAVEAESFVFDTRGLRPEARAQADVELTDSDVSDHFAVVLDLFASAPGFRQSDDRRRPRGVARSSAESHPK
jgi:endonuclease/exonuclease/phosphatase family metal-dependent hydrolase